MRAPISLGPKPQRPPWPVRALIAVAAPLPLLALMVLAPLSWWKASGFLTYPGTYVRVAPDNYWLCRPWPRHALPVVRGTLVATRFGSVLGAEQTNFAVLLPQTARVTAIYCGDAAPSSPLLECSGTHCAQPAHFQVEDGIYTLGRGVTFSVRAKTSNPAQRTNVGFWVMWSEARPPTAAN
jgi:hypothetical protein